MKRLLAWLVLLTTLAAPASAYNGRGFSGGFVHAIIIEAVSRLNIPHGASFPSSGQVTGDIYYKTATDELGVWNGSDWVVINSSGGGGSYTDEDAQDAVGTILVDSGTVDFTYSDSTPSITAAVINDSITNAKLANVATSTFKGRTTAGTGDPEDLTVSQAKTLLNLTGTNSGDQTITLTSDVTGSGTGSFATTIANDAVTNAKMANMAQATIKGRAAGAGTGDPTDLTASQVATIVNSSLDHGTLSGLGDDDHTQYALLAGRGTSQTLTGGTTDEDVLHLRGTTTGLDPGSVAIDESTLLVDEIADNGGGFVDVDGVQLNGGAIDAPNEIHSNTFMRAEEFFSVNGTFETRLGDGEITRNSGSPTTFDIYNPTSTLTLRVEGNTVWHAGNDGSGSGLDADLLDGLNSTAFVLASADTELAQDAVGTILTDSATIDFTYSDPTPSITAIVIDDSVTNAKLANMTAGTVKGRAIGAGTGDPTDITQGSGGGLDSDLLDGVSSGSFLRSDTSDNFTSGTLTTDSGTTFTVAGGANLSAATSLSLPTSAITGAGSGSGLDADKLDGFNSATAGGSANTVVVSNGSGKIPASFGGSASTIATLNASSLVVENPANATSTATASKIPISDGSAHLDTWISDSASGTKGLIQLTGQLGGSAASPTVTGIRETSGPTSLTIGTIGDGEFLMRSGSTLVSSLPESICPAGTATGVKTVRNSASQLQLVPSSLDSKARIALYDGSAWKCFTVTSTQTADITTSGANGLDTGAEASSVFYHLFEIGKSDGTEALLLSVSASSPTMPSGYTFKRLIGGDANDGSSNFVPFQHARDGWIRYKNSGAIAYGGVQVLSGGTSTATAPPAAIDLSKAIPDLVGTEFEILSDASNTGATGTRLDHFFTSTTTDHINADTVAQTANWTSELRSRFIGTMHATRATVLYYAWSAATSGRSADDWVTAWNIGIGWAN